MTSNVLECDICSNAFSEEYCPRFLPCSHTLCGHCIDRIIATNRNVCPFCRQEFTASSAEDLTINRIVLDIINQLSFKHTESDVSSSKEPLTPIQRLKEDFRENFINKGIDECGETEVQVLDAIKTYTGMRFVILAADEDIDGLMEKLRGIKMSHSEMLKNINQSIEMLKNTLDLTLQDEEKLKNFDAQLTSSADFTSAGPIIDEAEIVFNEVQLKIREIQGFLQKHERDRDDIGKEILNTKINLDNIAEEIQRRRTEEESHVNITASCLQNFGNLLGRIARREIYGVKMFNEKQMVSRIEIGSKNQASLNHFKEENLPPSSFIVKLDDLMSMRSRRGFLDVAANGTFLGRIIIKVIDEGNLALNFLHKCAGDLGSSYVNLKVFGLLHRGKAGETVGMGDYDASQAVLSEVDWKKDKESEIYKQTSFKTGQVTGCFSDEYASRLCIITRDNASWIKRGCFGEVEEGLDVLKDAISHYPDITQVKVMGCGLMFSLNS